MKLIKVTVLLTYLGMIIVNALANILPINGISTGEISDSYPNLFAPAGLTFSIWGLIYILLGAYTIYQFTKKSDLINKINKYFILTSVINILWIFSWHYQLIFISVILMIILLISLIKIANIINEEKLKYEQNIYISLPFTIYFGWITVATIANITIFLVSINWNGFGISNDIWTIIILLIGTLIGILRLFKDKRIAYAFVFIWAYIGIIIKHLNFFNNQYPIIIGTAIFCIILFIISIFYTLKNDRLI